MFAFGLASGKEDVGWCFYTLHFSWTAHEASCPFSTCLRGFLSKKSEEFHLFLSRSHTVISFSFFIFLELLPDLHDYTAPQLCSEECTRWHTRLHLPIVTGTRGRPPVLPLPEWRGKASVVDILHYTFEMLINKLWLATTEAFPLDAKRSCTMYSTLSCKRKKQSL